MNDVPDAIFPTDNECEIPVLDLELQADYIDAPVRGWGSVPRASRMRGIWHFYIDDYKFEAIWKNPAKVLQTKAISAVEVNFSTDDQMPYPVALYRIYQKRWLAKYWQTRGLRIFVDLNVARPWDEYNLLGVPQGWRAYATRASNVEIESLYHHYELAAEHSGSAPLMLVYGGGQKVRNFCLEKELIHIEDARNASRKAVKNG